MVKPTRLYIHTVTLQRADATVDGGGAPTRSYATTSTLACRLQVLGGAEDQFMGQQRSRYVGRGYCAPDADVREGDVFVYDGLTWQITTVIEPDFMAVFQQFDFERYQPDGA